MERKRPLRADPDKTRAWQQRSRQKAAENAQAKPRKPLPAVGAAGRRKAPALAAAFRAVDKRDAKRCQFHLLDPGHRCPPNALMHRDHLWGRLVRPEHRHTPWAIVTLCSVSHRAVTENPRLHRQLREVVLVERIVDMACGLAS